MLYISKGDEVILPKRYHRINNLCAIVYDQLTEILVDKNYDELKVTSISFDKKEKSVIDQLKDRNLHALDWLKKNNLNDELATVLTKHITLSILSDFVSFMYESLNCAKKGKMSVAYALLRKPLTDELLILEQLLYDKERFIDKFFHDGDPNNYDPSSREIDKRLIIKHALEKSKPNILFTEDLIYELRYDKSSQNGINGISNHALHIVTKDKNYKTDNQNFNFIFSNEEDMTEYWDHYYYFVPYLLMYSVNIIDSLIFQFLQDNDNLNIKAVKSFRRLVGLVLWTENTQQDMKQANEIMFKAFSSCITMECPKCRRKVNFTKPDFELFFDSKLFLCPKCFVNLLSVPNAVDPIRIFMDSISKG